MSLIKWEPFGEFDRFFNDLPSLIPQSSMGFDMSVDLFEDGDNLVAEMSLPGIDGNKIDVSVEGNFLRVSGSREEEHEKKEKQYYSKEIRRGSFERVVRLPQAVENEKVSAEYKNGLLKVLMPKKASGGNGKVKVEVK